MDWAEAIKRAVQSYGATYDPGARALPPPPPGTTPRVVPPPRRTSSSSATPPVVKPFHMSVKHPYTHSGDTGDAMGGTEGKQGGGARGGAWATDDETTRRQRPVPRPRQGSSPRGRPLSLYKVHDESADQVGNGLHPCQHLCAHAIVVESRFAYIRAVKRRAACLWLSSGAGVAMNACQVLGGASCGEKRFKIGCCGCQLLFCPAIYRQVVDKSNSKGPTLKSFSPMHRFSRVCYVGRSRGYSLWISSDGLKCCTSTLHGEKTKCLWKPMRKSHCCLQIAARRGGRYGLCVRGRGFGTRSVREGAWLSDTVCA